MVGAKKLSHTKYTRVRVSATGRREVYNADSDAWVSYAVIANFLSSSDRAVAESFVGTDASVSFNSPSAGSSGGSSDSGGGDGGGGD